MKKVKRVNNEVKKSIATKNNASEQTKKVDSYVIDKLKKIDYSKSSEIVKAISNVSFKVSAIRTAILAYVTKEANSDLNLYRYVSDDRIKVLRRSKKDRDLFLLISDLASFSYKRIVTKKKDSEDQVDYKKAYTTRSVLQACDIICNLPEFDITKEFVRDVKSEREKQAIQKLKDQINNLQNEAKFIADTIESLQTENNEHADLIKDHTENLTRVSKQLKNKSTMLDYVSKASNRIHIK